MTSCLKTGGVALSQRPFNSTHLCYPHDYGGGESGLPLGHSTIQLTVDTYTHWIEEVERGSQLEVDRLMPSNYSNEVGTFVGNLKGMN